jgi:regulator of protease activity HflC (stomatin/prohibitin superfamily)
MCRPAKAPHRAATYGKVTIEELDSDDEDTAERAPEDPLAEAAAKVAKLLVESSATAAEAQAQAQVVMEAFRCVGSSCRRLCLVMALQT